MSHAIRALVGIHFSRLRSAVFATLVTIAVLTALSIVTKGWSVDATVPWLAGGSLMLPLAPAFSVVKEKLDGSLRYLASLPVTGRDQALARMIVALILSFPGALLVSVGVHFKVAGVGPAVIATAFTGSLLMMVTASLALLALQIKARPGHAMTYVIYAFVSLLLVFRGLGYASEAGWLTGIREFASSPAGLAVGSLALWALAFAAGWLSFRSIAKSTVTYRGEPADP